MSTLSGSVGGLFLSLLVWSLVGELPVLVSLSLLLEYILWPGLPGEAALCPAVASPVLHHSD